MTTREQAAVEFDLLNKTNDAGWTESAKWKRNVLLLVYASVSVMVVEDGKMPTYKRAYEVVVMEHPYIAQEYNEVRALSHFTVSPFMLYIPFHGHVHI